MTTDCSIYLSSREELAIAHTGQIIWLTQGLNVALAFSIRSFISPYNSSDITALPVVFVKPSENEHV